MLISAAVAGAVAGRAAAVHAGERQHPDPKHLQTTGVVVVVVVDGIAGAQRRVACYLELAKFALLGRRSYPCLFHGHRHRLDQRSGEGRLGLRLQAPRGDRHRRRRATLPGRPLAGRPPGQRARAARRGPRAGEDALREDARAGHLGHLPAHPVHARPAARRSHRHHDLQPARRRLHHAEGARLRAARPGRRDPRSRSATPPTRSPSRSWSSRRRTRSSRRAPTRCPRRRSTASC